MDNKLNEAIPDNWKDHLWDKISTWQSREETRNDNSLYVRRSEQQKSEQDYKEIEDYIESLFNLHHSKL